MLRLERLVSEKKISGKALYLFFIILLLYFQNFSFDFEKKKSNATFFYNISFNRKEDIYLDVHLSFFQSFFCLSSNMYKICEIC